MADGGELTGRACARGAESVVPVHDATGPSLGAMVFAVPLALLAGFLLATLGALVTPRVDVASASWWLLFTGGGLVASWALARHARRILTVVNRAFLIGTARWIAVGWVGPPSAVAAAAESLGGTPGGATGVGLPQRLDVLAGPLALVMAGLCLLGLLVSWRLERDLRADPSLRPGRQAWTFEDPV